MDDIIVDEVTGEVSLAKPKLVRVREKNKRQSGGAPPPGKKKGAKKREPTRGWPRKLHAILEDENTPEKIQQASVMIKKTPSNVSHLAELAGLENATKVYESIVKLALDETLAPEVRGQFLKYVADRTIPRRVTKLLSLPSIPKVRTLDDIEGAMLEVVNLMQDAVITHEEAESFGRSFEHLASIMSAKQVAIVQQKLLQMQDSVIKTINKEVLLSEIDDRLMEYEKVQRIDIFSQWFKDYLNIDALLVMLGNSIKSEDDKIKMLKEISKICE